MNPSTPSHKGELDSCRTSQPCATACIQVPVLERNAPDQNNRKLRCRSARNISPTPRLRRCSSSSSVGMIKLIPLLDVRAKGASEVGGVLNCFRLPPRLKENDPRSHTK